MRSRSPGGDHVRRRAQLAADDAPAHLSPPAIAERGRQFDSGRATSRRYGRSFTVDLFATEPCIAGRYAPPGRPDLPIGARVISPRRDTGRRGGRLDRGVLGRSPGVGLWPPWFPGRPPLRRRPGWRGSARLAVAGEDGGAQRCGRRAEGGQDHRYRAVLPGEQGQREVLDADVVVVQRLRIAQRELQGLLCARRERDMAAGSRARQKRGVAARPCGRGGVATGPAATPTARQPGQRALPPDGPPALAGGREGPGQGVRAEDCFDPGADDIEVDADGSQRCFVEAARRIGRLASPDGAQYFRLDAFRRDTLVAQDRAGRFAGRGRGKQQVLAADVVMPEPAGIFLGLDDGVASGVGEALEHYRPPVRRPYLRWTVCLVTPRRLAMSCQDQPSSRARWTWSSSSRSASARRAATARSPTSGSSLAAPSAIWRAGSMPSAYADT